MGRVPSSFGRLSSAAAAIDEPAPWTAAASPGIGAFPRVGLIRNVKSHRNKGHGNPGRDVAGVTSVEPRTKVELEDAIAQFAQERIDLLAISGGDGTVRDVLTRGAPYFGNNWPSIIVLPQGKTNALAFDLGVPNRWTLAEALKAAKVGRRVTRRPLVVEEANGDHRTRYGFIFGAGVFNVALEAGQVAHRYGAFQSFAVGVTAAFGVLQALFGLGSSRWRQLSGMHIKSGSDGGDLPRSEHGSEGKRFLAGFASLRSFPLGLHPFPGQCDDDTISYITLDAPLRRAIALLPAALFGADTDLMRRLGILRGSVSEFSIELDDRFILDGETFPPGSYRVRLGPEIHFVAP